jgi:predicted nucleic acid-binding protein
MTSPALLLIGESADHWRILRELVESGRIVGPRLHDARVAALCLQHGVREFWSADRDFSRFPALRVVNPLLG